MRGPLLRFSCLWLSLLTAATVAAQQIKVVDEAGQPLIGVLVYAGEQSTTTDLDGLATLDLQAATDVSFEYLGYTDRTLTRAELAEAAYLCKLLPSTEYLEEVVIIGRNDSREIDLPYNVTHIKAEKIFSSNAQNTADALALNSGAYVQKSQLGGGSPVLRGFEANKILLVVDGVRLNNAIYRNGHLQNAITVDPAILQQIEVIYGPGSLLYGSEALGGVVHFRTQTPLLELSGQQTTKNRITASVRYNSADQEKTVHLDHMLSKSKFGLLTSASFSDRSDLRTGSRRPAAYPDFGKRPFYVDPTAGDALIANENENLQVGTGYSQIDFFQKYVYQPSTQFKTELNLQYSTSSDIPRYDNLNEYRNGQLRFAEWYYGPQDRLLISPKLKWSKKTRLFDKVNLIGSFQKIEESRYSRPLNDPELEEQIEDVTVYGLTLDFNKQLAEQHKLVYGADLHHNDVQSNAQGISPTGVNPILTRYPSAGSQLLNMGAYLQYNFQNRDSTLVWSSGLRYSSQQVDLLYSRNDPFVWPEFFYDGITSNNSALVGITGLNFQKGPLIAKAATGTAFRSPNVDDLAKVRVNGDEITVPNPQLDSEKVWNSEITLGYRSARLTAGLTGFYTRLTDAIVRTDFSLPNGDTRFVSNGDTLQVTANVNASSGIIRGLSVNLQAELFSGLRYEGTLSFQQGTQTDSENIESPLGHIPPTYGRNKLSYQTEKLTLSLSHNYNLWKRVEDYGGSVDNLDLATVDGAPEWHDFGISAQYHLAKSWTINAAVQNLSDLHYRPFASGVSAAGRHIVLAVRYQWEH